jgi:hypothetical protein
MPQCKPVQRQQNGAVGHRYAQPGIGPLSAGCTTTTARNQLKRRSMVRPRALRAEVAD